MIDRDHASVSMPVTDHVSIFFAHFFIRNNFTSRGTIVILMQSKVKTKIYVKGYERYLSKKVKCYSFYPKVREALSENEDLRQKLTESMAFITLLEQRMSEIQNAQCPNCGMKIVAMFEGQQNQNEN